MNYLSKDQLKQFKRRFLVNRRDKRGRLRQLPIPTEEAIQVIKGFVSLGGSEDQLKKSFIETRIKLLEICLSENTPQKRWKKARNFLVKKLETQIPRPYLSGQTLRDHQIKPTSVLKSLLNKDSILSRCIKLIVLLNVTNDDIKIPNDLQISYRLDMFPFYDLTRQGTMLRAHTKRGETIERYDPNLYEDTFNKFHVNCSVLIDQNSELHPINNDLFFQKLNELYPEYVEKYKLKKSMKPSYLLSKLGPDTDIYSKRERQYKLLKEITGEDITKYNWEIENTDDIDLHKISDAYFREFENEIISISWEFYPHWKPNDPLLDEASLRYELADLYLGTLDDKVREEALLNNIRDLSIFNLKAFRDMITKWENNKDYANIILTLQKLENHYYKHRGDPKERDKWLEYVRIETLLQKGLKPMDAYRRLSTGEKVRTIQKRYQRLKEKAVELGFNIKDPKHVDKIKTNWNIFDNEEFVI